MSREKLTGSIVHAAPPVHWPNTARSAQPAASHAPPPVHWPGGHRGIQPARSQATPPPPIRWPGGAGPEAAQPKAAAAARAVPPPPLQWPRAVAPPMTAQRRAGVPVSPAPARPAVPHDRPGHSVVQAMKRRGSSSGSDDEYEFVEEEPDSDEFEQEQKRRPAAMTNKLTEQVIRRTAHKKQRNVDRTEYQEVWTCPTCRRPLAYEDLAGVFSLVQFSYTSRKNKHLKTERATQPDHHPQWAPREVKLKQQGATKQEIRDDYLDLNQLRALCRVCNGSHKYEGKKVKDYDSDDSEGDPSTPSYEPENQGRWSFFHDPGGGGTGTVS